MVASVLVPLHLHFYPRKCKQRESYMRCREPFLASKTEVTISYIISIIVLIFVIHYSVKDISDFPKTRSRMPEYPRDTVCELLVHQHPPDLKGLGRNWLACSVIEIVRWQ
jgi:hypothetical protein